LLGVDGLLSKRIARKELSNSCKEAPSSEINNISPGASWRNPILGLVKPGADSLSDSVSEEMRPVPFRVTIAL
jgi:hypothetical protein